MHKGKVKMKVIKRDGREVCYDRTKIQIAIEKANKEVKTSERADKKDIDTIIEFIEELGKKRILVEDIQDIIEEKLMELKKYELAKKYIVYRYTRALVRKQNTTDETLLGIIRNDNMENNNLSIEMTAAIQRNYMAGEVSIDLTRRLLLPEKIAKSVEAGVLYFHNADYFVHPVIHSCVMNISDMLQEGTCINGKVIESPKSFEVACIVLTQIIMASISNQSGEQIIDISALGKYLKKSYEKMNEEDITQNRLTQELKSGIQIIQYQLNTLMEINGRTKDLTFFLYLRDDDLYVNENAKIIEEILKMQYEELKNNSKPAFPKLVFVLDDSNSLNGGKYDYLTNLAIKCVQEGYSPYFISANKMKENFGEHVFCPYRKWKFFRVYKRQKRKLQI